MFTSQKIFKMFSLKQLWFVCAFYWINTVRGEEACEFSNVDLKAIVAGIEGKVDSSEPLHRDVIVGDLPTLKYSFKNATLNGISSCEVIHTQCDTNSKKELTFQFHIQCAHISITSFYEVDGKLNTLLLQGHGTTEITADDYVILFNGNYEKVIGQDQKSHPVIKTFKIDTDPRGKVHFVSENKAIVDKDRDAALNRFLNENYKEMEKILRSPAIDSFMDLFVENFNAYSKCQ